MEIKGFRGFRFDPAVVGEAGNCVSPPYDVIDESMREALYGKSPYNIVRVIRGRETPEDTEADNKYTRAGAFMEELVSKGALRQDERECIYGYVQDFKIRGQAFQRCGFVALGKLAAPGSDVQPHEKTLDGPKADRLRLMRAKAAQLGQIFMLYDDPEKTADSVIQKAASKGSALDFTDEEGVRHRLYAIEDPADIDAVVRMMANKPAVIADGHHRYETALNYYNETKNPEAMYRMMTFVNMRNPGLVVLPTHRLVSNAAGFDIKKLISSLDEDFNITVFSFTNDIEKTEAEKRLFKELNQTFSKGRNAVGIYAADGNFYSAVYKQNGTIERLYPEMSSAECRLDVNVLHKLILEKHLGIDEAALAGQKNLEYIKDRGDAIVKSVQRVDSGEAQAVFFMSPTPVEQVKAVALTGKKMPQKSTFFYPKIYTGLVINKLNEKLSPQAAS